LSSAIGPSIAWRDGVEPSPRMSARWLSFVIGRRRPGAIRRLLWLPLLSWFAIASSRIRLRAALVTRRARLDGGGVLSASGVPSALDERELALAYAGRFGAFRLIVLLAVLVSPAAFFSVTVTRVRISRFSFRMRKLRFDSFIFSVT
jgi:hypothetical protein